MGELERLKEQNPHGATDRYDDYGAGMKEGYDSGLQAAWDAGWRPVPSEEECAEWLDQEIDLEDYDKGLLARNVRQWLLERGKDDCEEI